MILALATPGHTTRAWLFADGAAASAQLEWDSGRSLADELLGRLQTFLAEHHASFTDLTGIIIFSGPGSFTSLRIGHTIANALADSLAIPVVGVRNPGDQPDSKDWIAMGRTAVAAAKPGIPALPYYGAEANITKPKS
jgi:tRNA threonylcarbamoyladenosine biosynthesis protein TsaB